MGETIILQDKPPIGRPPGPPTGVKPPDATTQERRYTGFQRWLRLKVTLPGCRDASCDVPLAVLFATAFTGSVAYSLARRARRRRAS